MLFDAVKKFLGMSGNGGNQPRNDLNPPSSSSTVDDRLVPYRHPLSPDVSQIESEIAQVHKLMEEQMRSMMGSFGFTFGNLFSGFEDGSSTLFRSFPSDPHGSEIPIHSEPTPPCTVLNPRDEMLKPQFRSRSSAQWNGEDQILDDRVNSEGLDSIIDELKPSNNRHNPFLDSFSQFFENGMFSGGSGLGSFSSSSSVTIFSNVNGRTSVEKIVRHPDGKVERTVITNDENN